jgi:hypothetical protein
MSTLMGGGLSTSEVQSTHPIRKQSLTSAALKRTEGLECTTLRTQKAEQSGQGTRINAPHSKSIFDESLIKKREISYLAGSQIFFNDKNEVLMRKSPNLVMSPYECIVQLKCIYTHMENLKAAASFFETVLSDWEKHTKEVSE